MASYNPENPYIIDSNYYSNVTNLTFDQTPLSTYHFLINLIFFILGLFVGCLLIFLILTKTEKAFKAYSHLILICASVDLFYTVFLFLTQYVRVLEGV